MHAGMGLLELPTFQPRRSGVTIEFSIELPNVLTFSPNNCNQLMQL